jgi:AAA15 family ATPase/GTPase
MLRKIKIKNFRSIRNQEIELAPLVVIYGPTASGKSSLLYALLVAKNFLLNPNQQLDAFFNLRFQNLGGFDQVVFNKDRDAEIEIRILVEAGEYGIALSKQGGNVFLRKPFGNLSVELEGNITIPYGLNKNFSKTYKMHGNEFIINWNGITASVSPKHPSTEANQTARELAESLNQIPQTLRSVDIVPHRRGFFQPHYTPSSVSPNPVSESEVATIVINDPDLAPRISADLEEITGREFRLYTPPGTATVYFQTMDKKSKTPSFLVNDGFGVNQLAYILAKIYKPETKTVLIEEPEIHLHPTVIRSLIRRMCSIVKEESKQIILVTHSETLVTSLLVAIKEKIIRPGDVKLYLTKKDKKATVFSEQKVNHKGQVEGGLTSFVEGELEDLRIMLGEQA